MTSAKSPRVCMVKSAAARSELVKPIEHRADGPQRSDQCWPAETGTRSAIASDHVVSIWNSHHGCGLEVSVSTSRDGSSRRLVPILGQLHFSIETSSPSPLMARRGVAPCSRIRRCFRKDLARGPRMSATVRRVELIVTSERADSMPRNVGVLP